MLAHDTHMKQLLTGKLHHAAQAGTSKTGIALLALTFTITAGLSSAAQAADYIRSAPASAATQMVQSNNAGICQHQSVLKAISYQFEYQIRHIPELPKVSISSIGNIYQSRYEPKENPVGIARHYCGATALLSDGQSRSVWYLIEEGQGFASLGNNVEACVEGFDLWRVYDGRCRTLR